MLQVVFNAISIAAFACLWCFEITGPDGILSKVRIFWYYKKLPLFKTLFVCPMCFAGWCAIIFFVATTRDPLTVFLGGTWAMFFAKTLQEVYAKFS